MKKLTIFNFCLIKGQVEGNTSVYFHIFHIYCYCGPEFKHMQAHKLQWKLSKT